MVQQNGDEMIALEAMHEQEIEEALDEQEIEAGELAQELAMRGGYFEGPIPADIVAPPGLSPKRAELARFLEWRRRTVAELEHLEGAHHRAVEALSGESVTKKKIDALIQADIAEVLKFALGGDAITPKKLRAFERHQLEEKLKDDKHAAQVASETLREIEREIGVKTVALKFLDLRSQQYVKSAVVEAAGQSDLGELYLKKIAELRDVLLQLLGLGSVVGAHDDFHFGPVYDGAEIEFPQFGLPALAGKELKIKADRKALDTAAAPWQHLATEFLKNPTADAKAVFRHN
jgi:hypothetical protein